MLKDLFTDCCKVYSTDINIIQLLWEEIYTAYSSHKRHYHNLSHLQNIFSELLPLKAVFQNWEAVLFAVFYHDIIYKSVNKDNEEKSAALAVQKLSELGCPPATITHCETIILATKKHEQHTDSDVNYFTDADLSILGANWNDYQQYASGVRKEYAVFPDIIYKPGRRKVLQHFLSMERIFKTSYFFDSFEKQAKNNLKKELDLLS